MKKFRFEFWLLVLGLLLVLGMILTLLYGREGTSRHGYGRHLPAPLTPGNCCEFAACEAPRPAADALQRLLGTGMTTAAS